MDKFLVIVRHGDYGFSGGDEPLSELGLEQMRKLKKIIAGFLNEKAKKRGEETITQLFFSFSHEKRAIQSIQQLHWGGYGYDIIVTSEGETERSRIREPEKIVEKVLKLANHYGATVVTIVAHGNMPPVIAEAAYKAATGKDLKEQLPPVGKAHGFAVNLNTGEVIPIRHDLSEKKTT